MRPTIHLVDDDSALREYLGGYLRDVGFDVRTFPSVASFRAASASGLPDIVITDLLMPDEDGLALLSWVRNFSNVPVIMLTSQDDSSDRVVGLELGADDYLAKPCQPRELLACVRTQLRRLKAMAAPLTAPVPAAAAEGPFRWTVAQHVFDERSLELRVNGERVELARKPLELLMVFLRHPGEVLTKEKLIETVWPGRIVSDASLTNAMSRLRAALQDEQQALIKVVYGYGYRLEVKPERGAA
ncbi:two-component system OmpR family response regulator [Panacagrimonas perspica]|uniref:Two-component system OmpR family response regulator n=1 Tax=Panacagrimonas perspica TaxID=381431 RepID=A0A4S3K5Z5_9GAMM|nr:response regulator transcription factor [Panacagrimonas perspica]TDU26785.1 two-component system OmpR family response regulator [Panacagrimonas perspica]THD03569.1 hypothetical protein B1810_08415 [Panacagrimonas perspica]